MNDEIERISREQLEANVRALVRMLGEAQQTAAELGRYLRQIGHLLLPQQVERLREESPHLDDRAFASWLLKALEDVYGLVAVEGVQGTLARVDALQARVRELEAQVRSLEGRLQEVPRLQGEIEALQREVREKEQEIAQLRRDLVEREERIQDLQAEIAEREGRIEALEEALASGVGGEAVDVEQAESAPDRRVEPPEVHVSESASEAFSLPVRLSPRRRRCCA